MKKAIFLLIVLGLLGLVGRQVYTKLSEPGAGGPPSRGKPAVAVEVKPVQRGAIRDTGVFTGTLHPRSQFRVAPKIGGRLERLPVQVGDRVAPESLVAVLDRGEYVQQVEQARAELEVARAQLEESRSALEIAGRELERARALREKKIASASELDEAESEFKVQTAKQRVARAQVDRRAAALEAARVRLSYTRILAGGNGADSLWVVGERFVDEGAMLAPNQAIVSLLDIGTVVAVIHVIEKDYPKVRVGQAATVSAEAFPGERFPGRIVRLAPLLKETSRQARVEIEVPNPGSRLKPGMFVRAEIELARREDALLVPLEALVRREGHRGVFSVDIREARARFVPVTLGIVGPGEAEVLGPALEGPVVTMGHHLLEDGSPVLLPGGPATQGAGS
jgi:RND family efflux transporter MFP subunit